HAVGAIGEHPVGVEDGDHVARARGAAARGPDGGRHASRDGRQAAPHHGGQPDERGNDPDAVVQPSRHRRAQRPRAGAAGAQRGGHRARVLAARQQAHRGHRRRREPGHRMLAPPGHVSVGRDDRRRAGGS
ncbi:hypothetical protein CAUPRSCDRAFT_12944, partial [Caulochytrium protostelioides]